MFLKLELLQMIDCQEDLHNLLQKVHLEQHIDQLYSQILQLTYKHLPPLTYNLLL